MSGTAPAADIRLCRMATIVGLVVRVDQAVRAAWYR